MIVGWVGWSAVIPFWGLVVVVLVLFFFLLFFALLRHITPFLLLSIPLFILVGWVGLLFRIWMGGGRYPHHVMPLESYTLYTSTSRYRTTFDYQAIVCLYGKLMV